MCGSQRRLNPSIWNIQKNLGRPESWNNHARILMGKTCQTMNLHLKYSPLPGMGRTSVPMARANLHVQQIGDSGW